MKTLGIMYFTIKVVIRGKINNIKYLINKGKYLRIKGIRFPIQKARKGKIN